MNLQKNIIPLTVPGKKTLHIQFRTVPFKRRYVHCVEQHTSVQSPIRFRFIPFRFRYYIQRRAVQCMQPRNTFVIIITHNQLTRCQSNIILPGLRSLPSAIYFCLDRVLCRLSSTTAWIVFSAVCHLLLPGSCSQPSAIYYCLDRVLCRLPSTTAWIVFSAVCHLLLPCVYCSLLSLGLDWVTTNSDTLLLCLLYHQIK